MLPHFIIDGDGAIVGRPVSETETWYERVDSSNATEEIAAAVPPVMQFQLQVFIVQGQFL